MMLKTLSGLHHSGNMAGAVRSMPSSTTRDTYSMEIIIESLAGARYMHEFLAREATVSVGNMYIHWQLLSCTMYVFGHN